MDNLPDTPTELTVESSPESEENEALDPRVQIELERLNHANEAINNLELQLDEARNTLKEFDVTSEQELVQLENRVGKAAVFKAQSYYDARIKLRDAKEILTRAQHRFERAQALHVAAKELAVISSDRIEEIDKSDEQGLAAWNETYRHALAKSGDAEREKYQADIDQQHAERVYLTVEKLVAKIQKDYRRSINTSKPYYETKAEYLKELEFHRSKVKGLVNCVTEAKSQYQQSLKTLERISNEIHEQRNQGKLQKERTSDVDEKQLNYTDTKQINLSDGTLRSCILRTESLPAGVFTNTDIRYSPPEGDETTNDCHDQFILRSKQQPPQAIVLTNTESDINNFIDHMRDRAPSISSQMTDDDHTESLGVLTDEQVDHLASAYHDYPSDLPTYTDAIDELVVQLQNSKLQAKTFFRKLFKSNSLNA